MRYSAAVRKITASYAIAAVLIGFVYAPLFHVHGGDGHDMAAPVLHAHFPEPESVPPYTAFSAHDLHGAARSIDVLTVAGVQVVQIGAIVAGIPLEFDNGMTSFGFIRHDEASRAHAPPVLEFHSPRAPPV
jgi:hypothetical protein